MINTGRQRTILVAADLVSTSVAVLLFNTYRHKILAPTSSLTDYLLSPIVMLEQLLFPVMMLMIFLLAGYYNSPYQKSRLQDLISTIGSCLAGTMLIVFIALIDDLNYDRARDYSLFAVLFLIMTGCVWIPRFIITGITAKRLRSGAIFHPTLIVGYGSESHRIARLLGQLRPSMGFKPIAIATLDDIPTDAGLPHITSDQIESYCRDNSTTRIILLPHPTQEWRPTMEALRRFMRSRLTVLMPHDYNTQPLSRSRHLDVASEPLVCMTAPYTPASTLNIKRASDITVGIAAIALLAVPVGLLSFAIWISTGTSPIYSQKRLGKGGKPFNILKLRTMYADAEAEGEPQLSKPGDPRITAIGAFMRKYRLDELPQFINVVLGQMSIVGPRPEREFYVDEIIKRNPAYVILHQVRPGITSWGMVKYGYASTVEGMIERMRYDLLYVENLSFSLDLKILFYTFHTVITGKGI